MTGGISMSTKHEETQLSDETLDEVTGGVILHIQPKENQDNNNAG